MDLTVEIPDDIARRLRESGEDLPRRALEGLALEAYKDRLLTDAELLRLLGFGSRWELDGFLKAHGVFEEYTLEDFEREREALKSLGL